MGPSTYRSRQPSTPRMPCQRAGSASPLSRRATPTRLSRTQTRYPPPRASASPWRAEARGRRPRSPGWTTREAVVRGLFTWKLERPSRAASACPFQRPGRSPTLPVQAGDASVSKRSLAVALSTGPSRRRVHCSVGRHRRSRRRRQDCCPRLRIRQSPDAKTCRGGASPTPRPDFRLVTAEEKSDGQNEAAPRRPSPH
jgi:hypothetical protein